ncbi:putative Cell cycle checkpoint protein RAD1 [Hypsibius exemplaris]|uniref:Cell cycle checkpoint protein RAD1 n=1 Tax=Hypsibius exemplaris TaxID=2072580 RepID=A0A1W0WKQ7_HYPEX|nr:putative Cell cycle checkpoint protein RAD1 [Hypsibius exemplaris]
MPDSEGDSLSQLPPQQQPDNTSFFVGKLESCNFKNVIRIFKSITIKKAACFYVTERGLKIIVQESGNYQVTAYLQRDIFEYFQCLPPAPLKEIGFKVCLDILLNCLQMFVEVPGETTTGQFTYKADGHPLCVQLEQSGFFTSCDIKTMDIITPAVDVQFLEKNLISRMICKSDCFRDALHSLLAFPCRSFEVRVTKMAPYFLLRTVCDNVVCEVTVSKDSDFVERFQCDEETTFSYRTVLIRAAMKPLLISEKTSIRIDKHGVMALQFMIRNTENDTVSFVEIYGVPEQEPEEDD